MGFVERLYKIADVVDRPLWWVCTVLLVMMTLLTVYAVSARYFLNIGYQVIDEICRYSFIAIVYLWGGPIYRTGGHLRLELTPLEFTGRKKNIHQLIISIIYCGTCCLFFIWGISVTEISRILAEKSDSFIFMIWWIHAIVTLGMFLQVFYSFLEILKYIKLISSKEEITV